MTLSSSLSISQGDIHEDFCSVCRKSGQLLMCDTCSRVYHLDCLDPPLKTIPKGMWICPRCQDQVLGVGQGREGQCRGDSFLSHSGNRLLFSFFGHCSVGPILLVHGTAEDTQQSLCSLAGSLRRELPPSVRNDYFPFEIQTLCRMWWHVPIILALKGLSLSLELYKFKSSLSYIVKLHKKKERKENRTKNKLRSLKAHFCQSLVVHTLSPSSWEAETSESLNLSQPGLHDI